MLVCRYNGCVSCFCSIFARGLRGRIAGSTYRSVAAEPARRAGRAALDSMIVAAQDVVMEEWRVKGAERAIRRHPGALVRCLELSGIAAATA